MQVFFFEPSRVFLSSNKALLEILLNEKNIIFLIRLCPEIRKDSRVRQLILDGHCRKKHA